MRKIFYLSIICIWFLILVTGRELAAQAFSVSPTKLYFRAKDVEEAVFLTNLSDTITKRFDVRVLDWEVDSSGAIVVVDKKNVAWQSSSLFVPGVNSLILAPRERRELKIRYSEPAAAAKDATWAMLMITEISDDDNNGQIGIQSVYTLGIHLYHIPDASKQHFEVGMKNISVDAENLVAEVALQHTGNTPGMIVLRPVLQHLQTGKEYFSAEEQLTMLPGVYCRKRIKLGTGLPAGKYVLQITLDKGEDYPLITGERDFEVVKRR